VPIARGHFYIAGRNGKSIQHLKKEHFRRDVKIAAKGSRIANHAWPHNQLTDFENASTIDKGGPRTLEASLKSITN